MKQRPRIYYSDSQKALMWERWKQGWTLHEIGNLSPGKAAEQWTGGDKDWKYSMLYVSYSY